MSEQKYYTPAKEDFRIGYKYEFKSPISGDWLTMTVEEEEYEDDNLNMFKIIDLDMFDLQLRVPYLTDKQIEAEGWKLDVGDDNLIHLWKGEINAPQSFSLNYWQKSKNKTLQVLKHGVPIYDGTCRCLNDFRLICKLLGI